jgi:hypothetical protein
MTKHTKSGRLLREGDQLARLSPGGAGGSVVSAGSRPRSRLLVLMTCAGPGLGICSIWAWTWPPCRGWRGMLRLPRPGGTIGEIEPLSVRLRPPSTCPTRHNRTESGPALTSSLQPIKADQALAVRCCQPGPPRVTGLQRTAPRWNSRLLRLPRLLRAADLLSDVSGQSEVQLRSLGWDLV